MRCMLKIVSGDIWPPKRYFKHCFCSFRRFKAEIKCSLQSRPQWPGSLIGRAISQQNTERQEWPDRKELLVHQVFLRERQAFDEGPGLRHVLAVQYEDDA